VSVPAEGSKGRGLAVAITALVVAVAAGALVVVGLAKSADAGDSSGAGSSAAATTLVADAAQYAVDFTSFDYRTIKQDRADTAKDFTAAYAKAYLVQSKALQSSIVKAKAVAVAHVVASGLQSFDPVAGTATVLVAVDITTKNVNAPDGTPSYYRFSIPMQRQGNAWLANNMNAI
jgi:Mce-associated membrane protein